jgi:hypothetical protein
LDHDRLTNDSAVDKRLVSLESTCIELESLRVAHDHDNAECWC